MASLAKQMDKLQINVERRTGERFDEIQRRTQELSGRMEDIERRMPHRSPHSSQGSDDGYEEGKRHRHRRNRDGMDDVKVKIPKFLGTYDPEAYLDWEMKVDQIFNCNNFSEEKKMQLASLEFEEYVLVCWNQIQVDKE